LFISGLSIIALVIIGGLAANWIESMERQSTPSDTENLPERPAFEPDPVVQTPPSTGQLEASAPVAPATATSPTLPIPGHSQVLMTPPSPPPKVFREVSVESARVRSGPGTHFDKITSLRRGERVELLDTSSGWSKVLLPDGSPGWIRSDLVSQPQ